jgi:hypothetical protein
MHRTSVAKPVSRPRSRKPATVSASALAQHLDCSRTYIGKLEAEGVLRRASDGSGFGAELAPGIAAIGRLQSVTPPSSTTITRKNSNHGIACLWNAFPERHTRLLIDLRGGAGLMSAENTAGKQRGRPFQKGQSGNPAGRPNGSRNATTIALETLLDGQATALTQKAIDVALTGDIPALRLCLDRILPPRKDSPVAFDLPEMRTLNDAVPAMGALVKAVG